MVFTTIDVNAGVFRVENLTSFTVDLPVGAEDKGVESICVLASHRILMAISYRSV